jgi:hypothetical protein
MGHKQTKQNKRWCLVRCGDTKQSAQAQTNLQTGVVFWICFLVVVVVVVPLIVVSNTKIHTQ